MTVSSDQGLAQDQSSIVGQWATFGFGPSPVILAIQSIDGGGVVRGSLQGYEKSQYGNYTRPFHFDLGSDKLGAQLSGNLLRLSFHTGRFYNLAFNNGKLEGDYVVPPESDKSGRSTHLVFTRWMSDAPQAIRGCPGIMGTYLSKSFSSDLPELTISGEASGNISGSLTGTDRARQPNGLYMSKRYWHSFGNDLKGSLQGCALTILYRNGSHVDLTFENDELIGCFTVTSDNTHRCDIVWTKSLARR
jgi:hypothetical protein